MSKKTQVDRISERAYPCLGAAGKNAHHVITPNGAVIIHTYRFNDGPLTTLECSAGGKRHEERHYRHYSDRYLITLANRFAARVNREHEQFWRDLLDASRERHVEYVQRLGVDHAKAIAEIQAERSRWEESAHLWQENFDARVPQLVGELDDSRARRDEARRDCREALHYLLNAMAVGLSATDENRAQRLAARYLKPERDNG